MSLTLAPSSCAQLLRLLQPVNRPMRHNARTSQESRNSSISSSSIQYTWYSCSRFARTCAIASKTPTACSTASRDVNNQHSSDACACRVVITYRNNVGRPRQRQQVLRPQLRLALQGTGGGRGGSQKRQQRERDAGAGHVALDGCLLWRVHFHEVSAGGRVQLRRDCALCSVEPLGGESDEAHGLANDEKGG